MNTVLWGFFILAWGLLFLVSAGILINDAWDAYDNRRQREYFQGILERTGTPPMKEKTK